MARRRRKRSNLNNLGGLTALLGIVALTLLSEPWIFAYIIVAVLVSIIFAVIYELTEQKRLLESGIDEVDKMSGKQFEEFLEETFKKQRFTVQATTVTGDYGADLIMEKAGRKLVVQAKCWKHPVGVKAVQEVAGSIKHYKAQDGIVITNSYFTSNATKLAQSNGIELWDREKLISLIIETKKITSKS